MWWGWWDVAVFKCPLGVACCMRLWRLFFATRCQGHRLGLCRESAPSFVLFACSPRILWCSLTAEEVEGEGCSP